MYLDNGSFLFGFLFGFIAAGMMGWMLQRIQKARNAMRDPDRPMKVATANTPRSVMASAAQAGQTCITWTFFLLLFAAGVLLVLYALLFG